jgi:malonyl-CoA decarboxylase
MDAQGFLNDLMQTLTDRGRALLGRGKAPNTTDLVELAELLLSRRGEASGVVLAQTLLSRYAGAPAEVRTQFLRALADRFGPDAAALANAVAAYQADPSARHAGALHMATEPRRQELFRRLNLAPGGTLALVRMREDLLDRRREHPELEAVDADFAHLFASWFNRGFLEMKPIRWTSPANILEKIIRYEAVHPIAGWSDLKSRLDPSDRRCFGFFHPQLVDEPLIFVEVALTSDIPAAVAPLLAQDREPIAMPSATTAIFYSISNTQRGLAGVSFGHFLIKQVAEDLKRDLPGLRNFVTLSPVPGFAAWLRRERAAGTGGPLTEETLAALARLDQPGWDQDPATRQEMEKPLLGLAAHYLVNARTEAGRPIDPVARFHLGNGARLERVNFLGDPSERGLRQSHGIMVNYLYDLAAIEKNHEAYAEAGEVVASAAVRRLARDLPMREVTAAAG